MGVKVFVFFTRVYWHEFISFIIIIRVRLKCWPESRLSTDFDNISIDSVCSDTCLFGILKKPSLFLKFMSFVYLQAVNELMVVNAGRSIFHWLGLNLRQISSTMCGLKCNPNQTVSKLFLKIHLIVYIFSMWWKMWR